MTPLPTLADLLDGAAVVALPLVTRFRGIDVREAMLLRGPNGWTEFSPFPEYDDAEAATWLAGAIDFGWGAPSAPAPRQHPGQRHAAGRHSRRGRGRAGSVPRHPHGQGEGRRTGARRSRVTWHACAPRGRSWGRWAASVSTPTAAGTSTRRNGPPTPSPRSTSSTSSRAFAPSPELAELRDRLHDWQLPIAADESVRKAADPLLVAREGAADILVLKAQPLGGVTAALRIADEAGLPVVVSSALETSIGISMGAHLAAAIHDLEFDCGLGTVALLEYDVAVEPLRPPGRGDRGASARGQRARAPRLCGADRAGRLVARTGSRGAIPCLTG